MTKIVFTLQAAVAVYICMTINTLQFIDKKLHQANKVLTGLNVQSEDLIDHFNFREIQHN